MIILKIKKHENGKTSLLVKQTNASATTTTKQTIFAFKSPKLNNNGAKLIKNLLKLQKIAIDNDFTTLLNKVNQQLFKINEFYRNNIAKRNKIDFNNERKYRFLQFIVCYPLLED